MILKLELSSTQGLIYLDLDEGQLKGFSTLKLELSATQGFLYLNLELSVT